MTVARVRIAVLVASPLLLMGVVACGKGSQGGDTGAEPTREATSSGLTTSNAPTSEVTPTPPPIGDDAEKMANALQAAVPALKGRIKMTEDNDENDLFGRPGQYDQVTFLGDSRLGCDAANDFNNLDTACGVKIERWPSEGAAQARAEDIQQKLKDFGLGAEWDYVVGRLVVRASGDYKPTQAVEIQHAATAGDAVTPSA